jgi:hypothetical protein
MSAPSHPDDDCRWQPVYTAVIVCAITVMFLLWAFSRIFAPDAG